MKILHCVYLMDMGGIETLLMNIMRTIDRDEFHFTFACSAKRKGAYDDEIKALGGNIIYMPPLRRNNPFNLLRDSRALRKFFRENNDYDVCHMHMCNAVSAYPRAKFAVDAGFKKVIIHSHSTDSFNILLNNVFKRKLVKLDTIRLACSEEAGKWMFGHNANFLVINNAIDLEKFYFNEEFRKKIRNEFKIDDSTKVIGHVGRFSLEKNHRFIIEVFNEYHKINPDSVLMLVGVGELHDQIKRQVEEYGISDSVIFTGLRSDVNRVLQAFDLFLFPSLREGLAVVSIEAPASGLPVLLSEQVPFVQISDYIERLPLGDAEIWASRIAKMLRYDRTAVKFTEMKDKYDIRNTVKCLIDIYNQ